LIKLHGFYRSSASYRVRIALNLKRLPYQTLSHDLTQGAHRAPAYLAINPQGLLPALEDGDAVLTQSGAIIEYLEEQYPEPALLPADALGRARVRALFQLIAADTHHVTAMRVSAYLKTRLGHDDTQVREWQHHWLKQSFDALETLLANSPHTGRFSHGNQPTLADIALVPQLYSARRLGVAVDAWPLILRISDACNEESAFLQAHPDNQGELEHASV
jgi:maleylpyruvate isomerase